MPSKKFNEALPVLPLKFDRSPVWNMQTHKRPKDAAVVSYPQMQEFVYNDDVLERLVEPRYVFS